MISRDCRRENYRINKIYKMNTKDVFVMLKILCIL